METRRCIVEDCGRKHYGHGYCIRHLRQFQKYGRTITDEEKKKHLSDASRLKKQTLGKRWKIKDTSKMIGSHHPKTEFKKGMVSHNKGKKGWMTKEHAEALRIANTKYTDAESLDNRKQRIAFNRIRRSVLKRDEHTCQICGSCGGHLQVDHIKGWSEFPELRFDQDNCRTVCMACHYYVHYKRKLSPGLSWGHNLKKEGV